MWTIRTTVASVAVAYSFMMADAHDNGDRGPVRRAGRHSRHSLPSRHGADRYGENQYGEKPQHLSFPLAQRVLSQKLPHSPIRTYMSTVQGH